MANRQLKIILPNLTVKTASQGQSQSRVNIPIERSSHNSAISRCRNKWTLKQSYVQKRISHKKHLMGEPIDMINTHIAHDSIHQNDEKNIFFTGLNDSQGRLPFSKEQLRSKSIEKSKQFVDIIKSHRKKFIKIRMITEPKHKVSSLSTNTPKNGESKQLFNYLQRSFINEKKQNISDNVIVRFKTQSPQGLFEKIEVKSRKFLLEKMQNDYKNYRQIDNYKHEQIKSLIEEEIQRKKTEYKQDYSKRYSSPYFSFLSLNSEQKSNIILRRELNSLNSI